MLWTGGPTDLAVGSIADARGMMRQESLLLALASLPWSQYQERPWCGTRIRTASQTLKPGRQQSPRGILLAMGNDLEVARFCGGARVIVRRARVAGRILPTVFDGCNRELAGSDRRGSLWLDTFSEVTGSTYTSR